ncbi:MAG: hypothetical protein HY814_09980 [Candidatus Riflebacteria bacterium]|nr:hypothetical protein [Candidatus Riflebacteria bacterium]
MNPQSGAEADAIRFVTFHNARDIRPVPESLAWRALVDRLTHHQRSERKDGPAWSPAVYRDGATRGNDGVVSLTAAVLDLDKLAPGEPRQRRAAPRSRNPHRAGRKSNG